MTMRYIRNVAAVLMESSSVPGHCEETQCIPLVWVFLAGSDFAPIEIFLKGKLP